MDDHTPEMVEFARKLILAAGGNPDQPVHVCCAGVTEIKPDDDPDRASGGSDGNYSLHECQTVTDLLVELAYQLQHDRTLLASGGRGTDVIKGNGVEWDFILRLKESVEVEAD